MAPHSSTLAWKVPWTEEPGGLQSMGSPRVGHNWATSLSLFTFMHWRRKWQPTPVFLPRESLGQGSLVGLHRVRHNWSDLAAAAVCIWRGKQRMRWLNSITNSMDMNLSKLQEIMENRGVWHAAVHGVTKSQTKLSNWTTSVYMSVPISNLPLPPYSLIIKNLFFTSVTLLMFYK